MILAKPILYCDTWMVLACDGRCDKAWGIQGRATRKLSADEDDYVYLGDGELGVAPGPGETAIIEEGEDRKPSATALCETDSARMNRWCARQCERSRMYRQLLPNMESPEPNLLSRQEAMSARSPEVVRSFVEHAMDAAATAQDALSLKFDRGRDF